MASSPWFFADFPKGGRSSTTIALPPSRRSSNKTSNFGAAGVSAGRLLKRAQDGYRTLTSAPSVPKMATQHPPPVYDWPDNLPLQNHREAWWRGYGDCFQG